MLLIAPYRSHDKDKLGNNAVARPPYVHRIQKVSCVQKVQHGRLMLCSVPAWSRLRCSCRGWMRRLHFPAFRSLSSMYSILRVCALVGSDLPFLVAPSANSHLDSYVESRQVFIKY